MAAPRVAAPAKATAPAAVLPAKAKLCCSPPAVWRPNAAAADLKLCGTPQQTLLAKQALA